MKAFLDFLKFVLPLFTTSK